MHQSVVEYEVAPAAMTAVPGYDPGVLSDQAPCGGVFSAYLRAAGIAAFLLAVWAGLCVI